MHELSTAITTGPARQEVTVSPDRPDIDHMLAGRLTASSIAMYKRDVQAYLDYATEVYADWRSPQTLMDWRDFLAVETTKSPHTINRMLSAVKRIISEMNTRHLIEETVALQFERIPGVKEKSLKHRLKPHVRTRIEPEDMRRLCEAPPTNTPLGLRDRALLATLASSGIRASEAATLKLDQVHKQGRGYYLEVVGKTDTEPRKAHLSVEAYNAMQAWLQARTLPSEYLFTSFSTRGMKLSSSPISETAVWLIVRKYARACGLEHVKPHDLRRFLGTQLAAKDIHKAQKALGHVSIDTTASHDVLEDLEIGLTDNLY